jgi:hypothetical protein
LPAPAPLGIAVAPAARWLALGAPINPPTMQHAHNCVPAQGPSTDLAVIYSRMFKVCAARLHERRAGQCGATCSGAPPPPPPPPPRGGALTAAAPPAAQLALPYWQESAEARWKLAGVVGLTLATTGVRCAAAPPAGRSSSSSAPTPRSAHPRRAPAPADATRPPPQCARPMPARQPPTLRRGRPAAA